MITQIDIMIMEWINQFHNPLLDSIMVFFTHLGDVALIWFLLVGVLLYKKQKKETLGLIIAIVVSTLITEIVLKNIFMRPRPFVENKILMPLIERPTSSSFPSGHTASSMAAASYLTLNKCFRRFSIVVALMISFSRIYVNVHHPSDVLAGILVGIVVGIVVQFAMKKIKKAILIKKLGIIK